MGTTNVRTFSRPGIVALVAAAALLAGCAGAPVQMMSDTRQTISAAEAAGASNVAPQALAAAREELHRAEQMLRNGEYREARREAEVARQSAADALSATQQSR
jgi:uncharacterized membrane protein